MSEQLQAWLPVLALLLCCVVPFVVILLASWWALQNAPRLLTPDMNAMRETYERLRAGQSDTTTDQLINRMIHRQALRSGAFGALTSVGGLPLLPIGLVIDLATSARLQSEMLHFIAWAYRGEEWAKADVLALPQALALRANTTGSALLLEGGQQVSRYVLGRLTVLIAEKSFAKLIPGLGLIAGFVVNYLTTQAMGRLAARWYAGKLLAGLPTIPGITGKRR
jgi:hypothetical protein